MIKIVEPYVWFYWEFGQLSGLWRSGSALRRGVECKVNKKATENSVAFSICLSELGSEFFFE